MSTKKDKVSILTTYYNEKDFILNAIDSILWQKYDPNEFDIEYVIVYDCGDNECWKLVADHIKIYKGPIKIKHISTPYNLGCGGARRFGIEQTTGQFLMFLDADDYYIHDNFVRKAYHTILSEDADIVEYGIKFTDHKYKEKILTLKNKVVIANSIAYSKALFEDGIIRFNVWTKIYRRNICVSYPYSNARVYEDIRTIPIWVFNAKKIVIMNSTEINYRFTKNSIIRNNPLETRLGTLYALEDICAYFSKDKNIIKSIYKRALIDLKALMINKTSDDKGFNEASSVNTKILSYIFPDNYKDLTFNI